MTPYRGSRGLAGYVACLAAVLLASYAVALPAPHGTARWKIKVSIPATANLSKPMSVSLSDFLSFPDPQPAVKHNDKKYDTVRIPKFPNKLNLAEGDVVSTVGWLHLVAGEDDGDYHIQISGSSTSGTNCLIVELPHPQTISVSPSSLRVRYKKVRDFIKKTYLKGKEPATAGTSIRPAQKVVVTGQLFYDDSHVGDAPRGKKGMKAATLWEIHPITAFQVAP